jgi:hypothetical protein
VYQEEKRYYKNQGSSLLNVLTYKKKATEELTLVAIVLCIKQLQLLATVDYYQVLPLRL